MENIRKFRRLLAVLLLCTGLSGLASVSTPALRAATQGATPVGAPSTYAVANWSFIVGFLIGVTSNGIYSSQADTLNPSTNQLAAATYHPADFAAFDK